MRAARVPTNRVFMDKQSGKNFGRASKCDLPNGWKKATCSSSIPSTVWRGNYHEIQKQWRLLTVEKGIDIIVLDIMLHDTRQAHDLIDTFIANLVLQLLSFIAPNERLTPR